MDEAALEQIRKARLEQLKAQNATLGGRVGAASSSESTDVAGQDEEAQKEARKSILAQILEPDAADRLGRIRLVKGSHATEVENRLIMLARSGQLRSKVTEQQMKELLGAVAGNRGDEKIVVSRRKGGWDDDDDDSLGL